MKKYLPIVLSLIAIGIAGVAFAADLKTEIRKVLKENPEILFEIIRENPTEFMDSVQDAVNQAKQQGAANQGKREQQALEAAFANPLKPVLRKDETIRGVAGAPLVLVEYSDFECPYCARGSQTVQQLLKKYDGKIAFVYKHLPLDFHPQARLTAQYYEAIRLENAQLAFKFHDAIFTDVGKLKEGEPYLKRVAKQAGVNMQRLAGTLKDKAEFINNRINEDIKEAGRFNFQGTPGFLLNGIAVRGAYPLEYFEMIIEQLQKRDMLKL